MSKAKLTSVQIMARLAQHSGDGARRFTDVSKLAGVVYTNGFKDMCELCGGWWLFDIILSYQVRCRRDERLREYQFWTLNVEDGSGVVSCSYDDGEEAFRKDVEMTDFPLAEQRAWLVRGQALIDGVERSMMVAMLPTEY